MEEEGLGGEQAKFARRRLRGVLQRPPAAAADPGVNVFGRGGRLESFYLRGCCSC